MAATPIHDAALAAALRRLRREREFTQEDVAIRAGLSMSAYVHVELGNRTPSWRTVRKIAEALELSLEELAQAIEREEG